MTIDAEVSRPSVYRREDNLVIYEFPPGHSYISYLDRMEPVLMPHPYIVLMNFRYAYHRGESVWTPSVWHRTKPLRAKDEKLSYGHLFYGINYLGCCCNCHSTSESHAATLMFLRAGVYGVYNQIIGADTDELGYRENISDTVSPQLRRYMRGVSFKYDELTKLKPRSMLKWDWPVITDIDKVIKAARKGGYLSYDYDS